jgi:Kef-type K+ transport system membrane component KefB
VVPVAAGAALTWLALSESPAKPALVLLVGVALSISAIPESVKIFTEFGLLRSAVGETVVAAAVIADVLGLFLLALLTSVIATGGFLGPLFFASIRLRVELDAVIAVPVFVASLIAVAFLGKVVGAGLPARWAGLSGREALAVGIGMNARGAVELVIISIAYEAGLFVLADNANPIVAHLFSALVLMAVVTTLMTPLLLRLILGRDAGRQP